MSKSQHGNKEAKKPKKAASAPKPLTPTAIVPSVAPIAPGRQKKK